MVNIPINIKRNLFEAIVHNGFIRDIEERGLYKQLVELATDVDALQSGDPRFSSFIGDFTQHCINNNDWDEEYLFIERLGILKNDDNFQAFVEAVLNPSLHENETTINNAAAIVTSILKEVNFGLSLFKYDERGLPYYLIVSLSPDAKQREMQIECKYRFVIENNPDGKACNFSSHQEPSDKTPCFMLVFNSGWNDFSVMTWYELFWYGPDETRAHIGTVKILAKTEKARQEIEDSWYKTKDYLPTEFFSLQGIGASLGQNAEYYNNIKRLFPDDYMNILWALQDCAIYPHCEEEYCNHRQFHSLIRASEAERLLREEKFRIKGLNVQDWYRFTFSYKPKYSENFINLDFDFTQKGGIQKRLYAIIGENGVGKTQMLSSFPQLFAAKSQESFVPHLPIVSRVLTVSTSIFDDVDVPVISESFTYDFCGLRFQDFTAKQDKATVMQRHILEAVQEIEKHERTQKAADILGKFLPSAIMDDLFWINNNKLEFNNARLFNILGKLSSGESNLVVTFCDIIAKLRQDTLLLIDEPETHLHPKAISRMMNALYKLLDDFKSYAIVATHSSLVVREVMADHVYIIKRNGNIPVVGKIQKESFGANLETLSEEIFGARADDSYYYKQISEMAYYGMTYEKILGIVSSEGVEPNFNMRLFIKNVLPNER